MRLPLIPLVLVTVLLSGCSAALPQSPEPSASHSASSSASATANHSAAAPAPTSSASGSASNGAQRQSISELAAAVVASGFECPDFVPDNMSSGALSSGVCRGSQIVLSTFASSPDVDAILELNDASIEPGPFLVGRDWLIGAYERETLDKLQRTLGGTVHVPKPHAG